MAYSDFFNFYENIIFGSKKLEDRKFLERNFETNMKKCKKIRNKVCCKCYRYTTAFNFSWPTIIQKLFLKKLTQVVI